MTWKLLLLMAIAGCSRISPHAAVPAPVHHYVFFGQDRERIAEPSFLESKALEGAQVAYSWRQLEPQKDAYDFGMIREDLAFLTSRGKKLFVQIQDVTFSVSRINVPLYLQRDPIYNGGADKQYEFEDDGNRAVVAGWAARRWDPAVQERFHKLLLAAAKESGVGVGGPDLLPHRQGQLKSSYPLIRDAADFVPTGIAVQDGNLEDVNPATGKRVEVSELVKFATEYLKIDYIFWGTQEPYYSTDVIPFLNRHPIN